MKEDVLKNTGNSFTNELEHILVSLYETDQQKVISMLMNFFAVALYQHLSSDQNKNSAGKCAVQLDAVHQYKFIGDNYQQLKNNMKLKSYYQDNLFTYFKLREWPVEFDTYLDDYYNLNLSNGRKISASFTKDYKDVVGENGLLKLWFGYRMHCKAKEAISYIQSMNII